MLVVDLCNKETIENLKPLYERVRNLSGFPDDNFPCVLVGIKQTFATTKKRERLPIKIYAIGLMNVEQLATKKWEYLKFPLN